MNLRINRPVTTLSFIFMLFTNLLAQDYAELDDSNFNSKIDQGIVVIVFSSDWADSTEISKAWDVVKSLKGYHEAVVYLCKFEPVKKATRKLRLRTFPTVILFHDGAKQDSWKADFDGAIKLKNKDIKKAIDDAFASNVY